MFISLNRNPNPDRLVSLEIEMARHPTSTWHVLMEIIKREHVVANKAAL